MFIKLNNIDTNTYIPIYYIVQSTTNSLRNFSSLLCHPEPHGLARAKVVVMSAPHLVLQDDFTAP